jgi:hypothetical protein
MAAGTESRQLTAYQIGKLRALARDPADTTVEPATLGKLRRLGLVGKVIVTRNGHQKTTSPITPAGAAALEEGP